jgi:hypothetical protein
MRVAWPPKPKGGKATLLLTRGDGLVAALSAPVVGLMEKSDAVAEVPSTVG